MNRTEIVEKIARETGIRKSDVLHVVDGFLSVVMDTLGKADSVELRGFGTFKVDQRKERQARNPRTGEAVTVPAKKVPVFKPSGEMKKNVNQ